MKKSRAFYLVEIFGPFRVQVTIRFLCLWFENADDFLKYKKIHVDLESSSSKGWRLINNQWIDLLICIFKELFNNSSYPFGLFDKVASTGTLGNSLWKNTVLDGLLRLLNDVCKLRVVWEIIEVSAVVA